MAAACKNDGRCPVACITGHQNRGRNMINVENDLSEAMRAVVVFFVGIIVGIVAAYLVT